MVWQRPLAAIVAILTIAITTSNLCAQPKGAVSPQDVRNSIDKGIEYLKKAQKPDGSWQDYSRFRGGVTSLVTLALIESGVPKSDPTIQKALAWLRGLSGNDQPDLTYVLATQTMVFCAVEPEKNLSLIKSNAARLESFQIKSGERSGLWSYGATAESGAGGDGSNGQFALLALDEAAEHGAEVSEQTWRRALNRWSTMQNLSGSWGYTPNSPGTGSMTCAGLTSMIIAQKRLKLGDVEINNDAVNCCAAGSPTPHIDRGFQWLGRNLSLHTNPSEGGGGHNNFLYYLYGVERVGRLSGRRFLGDHDWYREGAEVLVSYQDSLDGTWRGTGIIEQGNPLIATSLALLFLAKGRRPVLVSKLRYTDNNDWNPHRNDLQNLNRYVEGRWDQKMTWQVINLSAVTNVEEMLQSPVLWISGKDGIQLDRAKEALLKKYLEAGGFIFAEAGCGGTEFDDDFRAMLGRILPESEFRLLPPDHPVWFAEEPVSAEYAMPLYGLDACCRTSVVYTPKDLSCYWELYRSRSILDDASIPQSIRDQVKTANAIGANVLAYATGRQLKDKLERVELTTASGVQDNLDRNLLQVAKIQHSGGSDDAPAALTNMIRAAGDQLNFRFSAEKKMVRLADEEHFNYPILFMHGRRGFRFTDNQRTALQQHLDRGGFLFVDSICASNEFSNAVRSELRTALPQAEFRSIPIDHPLLSREYGGFDITSVQVNDPQSRSGGQAGIKAIRREMTPVLEGVWIDDRLAVVFSPLDMSCAMESGSSLECKGYLKPDAARIATNILLYAMQQ